MFGFGGSKATDQQKNALIDATASEEVSKFLIVEQNDYQNQHLTFLSMFREFLHSED